MDTTKENYLPAFPQRRGVFISWRLLGFIAVGVLAVVVTGLLMHWMRGSDFERGTRLLIEAYSKQRMIEPRLSGGFKGGEFNPAENGKSHINTADVNQATELIENAFAEHDPYSRLAYGRLLVSKGGKGADALKHLRLAVAELPGRAEPHNDLGVCLLEQGDLESALDEFNLALQSKPDMAEALFNRGLCYERLFLRDAASGDYSQLLKIERDRSWMDEIKRRQEETSAPITPAKHEANVSSNFDAAVAGGNFIEARILIHNNMDILQKYACRDNSLAYLKAVEAGNQTEADRILSGMKLIGEEFTADYNDTSITDLATYLISLPPSEIQTEIKLISDHFNIDRSENLTEKQAANETLKSIFESRHNYLFQFLSTYNLALCDFFAGRYGASAAKLEQSLIMLSSHKWPYRQSLVELQLGYTYAKSGQDALAIRYYKQAMEHGDGAPMVEAKALQLMATAYSRLGNIKTGLDCLRRSTSLYFTYAPQFGELSSNSLQIADFSRMLGNNSLALLYARQALSLAEQGDNNKYIAQSDSFIAVERARQNQVEETDEEMDRAFDNVEKIDRKEKAYTYNKSLVLRRAGEIAARRDKFETAVQYYSQAEAVIKQTPEDIISMLAVLRGRAGVYTQAKDYSKARKDLQRASQLIETYRNNITDQQNRSAFLDASQSVFDDMIRLNTRVFMNQKEAFDISEQSRARTLLDDLSLQRNAGEQTGGAEAPHTSANASLTSRSVKPLTLPEVQKALPDDLRLVTYSVTDRGTFIFLVTRSGFEWAESPATTETLDLVVQDYISSLKRIAPLDELTEKAHAIYRYLIGPIEGRLGDGKQLCIVPDKTLHFLPFAALVDESGKYLINSYRLTYTPSASVLVRCITEARAKGTSGTEKILAVGNPLFNKAKFQLDELLEAEREAKISSEYYVERVVLCKEEATRETVREALMDCDVAHLSLHCLVEEKTPWLAALVLAESRAEENDPASEDNGLLYLSDIYRMSLPRMRLVILSACESGLGQYYRGEGIVSLVRPFLALKVPTVIATLWSVDSPATAKLMIDFHRERKKNNLGAGDALRNAQLEMVKTPSYQHPYYWAPFIMVGSNN